MGSIRLATLVQGLAPAGKGINQAYRAIVATEDGEVEAYVKKLADSREILVECVCAAIGRALKLPVPEPLLVLVPQAPGVAPQLAYGSVAVNAPDLHTLINAGQDRLVNEWLGKWDGLAPAGCFDEWIANTDRNQQNLLFDGLSQFWLIDHGRCLPPELSASDALTGNPLLTIAAGERSEQDLVKLRSTVVAVMQQFGTLERPVMDELAAPLSAVDAAQLVALIDWLELRQAHLVRLGSARVPARQADWLAGDP